MDIPVDAAKLVGSDEPITIWTGRKLTAFRTSPYSSYLFDTIDQMGNKSKVAQKLSQVLTTKQRMVDNPNHRLYLFCIDKYCIGILKVGIKKLFVYTKAAQPIEMEPLCVLDFYVHESQQRNGYGRMLFDFMLERENVPPHKLGYDRPSPKLLGFLRKHFGLSDYVPQVNNFVVFNQYFEREAATAAPRLQRHGDSLRQPSPEVAPQSSALNHPQQQQQQHVLNPSRLRSVNQNDPSAVPSHSSVGTATGAPLSQYSRSNVANAGAIPSSTYMTSNQFFQSQTQANRCGGARASSQNSLLPPGEFPSRNSNITITASGGPRGSSQAATSDEVSVNPQRPTRRTQSPTRSGAGYDIITLQDSSAAPGGGVAQTVKVGGRRSTRPF